MSNFTVSELHERSRYKDGRSPFVIGGDAGCNLNTMAFSAALESKHAMASKGSGRSWP